MKAHPPELLLDSPVLEDTWGRGRHLPEPGPDPTPPSPPPHPSQVAQEGLPLSILPGPHHAPPPGVSIYQVPGRGGDKPQPGAQIDGYLPQPGRYIDGYLPRPGRWCKGRLRQLGTGPKAGRGGGGRVRGAHSRSSPPPLLVRDRVPDAPQAPRPGACGRPVPRAAGGSPAEPRPECAPRPIRASGPGGGRGTRSRACPPAPVTLGREREG